MAGRTVGQGRGSVYVDGKIFLEGSTIPSDVEVGDHVFTDATDDSAGQAVSSPVVVGGDATNTETAAAPNDGSIPEIRARLEAGEVTAQAVLDAELAVTPKKKQRSSLIDELKAAVAAEQG